MATSTQVQMQMQARCTAVLVTLTVKAEANLSRVMALMPEEMRDTAKLYLEGKIVQWYSQVHGRGVVFLFAAESAEQVERWTEPLPLVREKLVDLAFMPLGPLMPMWFLLKTPDPDALQNAASIAGLMLTTEAMVADIPEPKGAPACGGDNRGGGMEGMY